MPTWTGCDATVPARSAGPNPLAFPDARDAYRLPRLGDDINPVAVIICRVEPLRRADGGQDLAFTESRADNVADLLAALRLPDDAATARACTFEGAYPPWLVLLDGQHRWVRPGIPYDACGKPRIEVRTAVDGLKLTVLSSRPIRQIGSGQAVAAGCAQSWADMVWVMTNDRTRAWTEHTGPVLSRPVTRLCSYQVPPDEQRTAKPGGEFAYGGPLGPDRAASIERAIRTAGPAAPCTTPAGQFAVLRTDPDVGQTYVEQDGCQRILILPNAGQPLLRQATADLLTLLAKA